MIIQQNDQKQVNSTKQVTQAIIVAQSFSEDLEPLNVDMPAVLLPVGNVPIIDLLIKHLLTYGITNIHIIGSNMNKIKNHVRLSQQYSKAPVQFYSYETQSNIELLVSFFKDNPNIIDDSKDDYFYVFNGPIVTNVNLYAAVRSIADKPQANLVLTQKLRGGSLLALPEAPFQMVLGADGRLLRMSRANKRTQAQTLNLSGAAAKQKVDVTLCQQPSQIFLLNRSFMSQLKSYYVQSRGFMSVNAFLEWVCPQPDEPLEIYTHAEGPGQLTCVIDSMRQYRGCCRAYLKRYFYPHTPGSMIYSAQDTLNGQNLIKNCQKWVWERGSPEVVVGPDTQIYRDAKLEGQCIIGGGCKIKGLISGSQIQDGCFVDEGAGLKNCVLMKRVTVSSGSKLEACIIMERARIEQNIVLPRGSVVGPAVVVTWQLVQAATRFFLAYIWDATRGQSHHLRLTEREMSEVREFLGQHNRALSNHVIERLPPIFLMKQEIFSKEKVLRAQQQELTTDTGFWQYQLCDMQESHTKKNRQAQIQEQQMNFVRSQSFLSESVTAEQFISQQQSYENLIMYQADEDESFQQQLDGETQEFDMNNGETDQEDIQEISNDATEPAKLALEIANNMKSQLDDHYWVPNYVIRLAKRIRDKIFDERNGTCAVDENVSRQELFSRTSLEVSRRVLGQGMRNSFSVLQQTHNDIIMQSVFSKQMKQFLRENHVNPEQNTNEVVYNTQELLQLNQPTRAVTQSLVNTTKAIGTSEDEYSSSEGFLENRSLEPHRRNDAIIGIERRLLAKHGAEKQLGKLHKQRVLLLERREENVQVQILQILQGILRNQSFIDNEIDVRLLDSVKENLQQLKRQLPVKEQAHEAFRSQTLRTLILITLNDTDGVDKEGNVIVGRQNINQPLITTPLLFRKLLEFMCHGGARDAMLVGADLEPQDACMYVLEDIAVVMTQTGLAEKQHLKLAKSYINAMLSVGLLDKSALLDEYAPMYVEDFEADLETDAFQQKLFQAWDELGGDED